jgi:chromosome segregation ATPase
MWGNLGNLADVVGSAMDKVAAVGKDLEARMDNAVGVESDALAAEIGEISSLDPPAEDHEAELEPYATASGPVGDMTTSNAVEVAASSSAATAAAEKALAAAEKAAKLSAKKHSAELASVQEAAKSSAEKHRVELAAVRAECHTTSAQAEDAAAKLTERDAELAALAVTLDKSVCKVMILEEEASKQCREASLGQDKLKEEIEALQRTRERETEAARAACAALEEKHVRGLAAAARDHKLAMETSSKKHSIELAAAKAECERVTGQLVVLQNKEGKKKGNQKKADEVTAAAAAIEIGRLTQSLSEQEVLVVTTKGEVRRLTQALAEQEGLVETTQEELRIATGRIQKLEQTLVETTSTLEAEKTGGVALRDGLAEELASERAASQTSVGALKKQLQSLESELAVSRASVEAERKAGADLQESISSSAGSMVLIAAQVEELKSDKVALETKLGSLTEELAAKDGLMRKVQMDHAQSRTDSVDSARITSRLKEQLEEKHKQLGAFEAEGKALAKKQSEMEKNIRKARGEVKEKDKEIEKLRKRVEELSGAIAETQNELKSQQQTASSAGKSLSAMQAVSQASTEKMIRLETEVVSKTEEVASQKQALESAWAEAAEAKRLTADLRAERDNLAERVDSGSKTVQETEAVRRDSERREAVLQATTKQLEESLDRHMQESAAKEERMREESYEMRRKWQDALALREAMSNELGEATAPLLRQVASLQDALRMRTEGWQSLEAALAERAMKAEAGADKLKALMRNSDVETEEMKSRLERMGTQLAASQAAVEEAAALRDSLEAAMEVMKSKVTELESALALELAERGSRECTVRELESRLAAEELRGKQAADAHKVDLETLELNHMNELTLQRGREGAGHGPAVAGGGADASGDGSWTAVPMAGQLPSGGTSYAAAEQRALTSQRSVEDEEEQLSHVRQLEKVRDSLLEEVTYLSERNAELEEGGEAIDTLRAKMDVQAKTMDALLTLLGEKEEEVEAQLGDMREVKTLYADQIRVLSEQLVGSVEAVGTAAAAVSGLPAAGNKDVPLVEH